MHKQFIRDILLINSIEKVYFNYDQFVDKSGKVLDDESMNQWKDEYEDKKKDLKDKYENEPKMFSSRYKMFISDGDLYSLPDNVLVIFNKKSEQEINPEIEKHMESVNEFEKMIYKEELKIKKSNIEPEKKTRNAK
ncbi:hypothetical protein OCOL_000478 [Ordospora colligata]